MRVQHSLVFFIAFKENFFTVFAAYPSRTLFIITIFTRRSIEHGEDVLDTSFFHVLLARGLPRRGDGPREAREGGHQRDLLVLHHLSCRGAERAGAPSELGRSR